MSTRVPFLTRDYIEAETESLLAAYSEKYGPVKQPPIPADEILNTYLRVTLDFDDLPRVLGVGTDVFGATWIDRGQVIIDQSLDPTNHPERIGRYNFTIAHETGHWQLHRPLLLKDANQQLLFSQEQTPTVICRSSEAKEPIEWQADFFAACLLMPKRMLKDFCQAKYALISITLDQIRTKMRISKVVGTPTQVQSYDDKVIEAFAKPFAKDFAVSPVAMRIRLESLGVIVREVPTLFVA